MLNEKSQSQNTVGVPVYKAERGEISLWQKSGYSDYPGCRGSQLGWNVRELWGILLILCILIWELTCLEMCQPVKNPLNYTVRYEHFSVCIFDFNEKNNTCHDKGGRIGSSEHKEPSTAITWFSVGS